MADGIEQPTTTERVVSTESADVQTVQHSRHVTGTLSGRLQVGSWDYPYRIYDGQVQYNSKRDGSGEWKQAPAGAKRID